LAVPQEVVMRAKRLRYWPVLGILAMAAALMSCVAEPPPQPLDTTPTFEPKTGVRTAPTGPLVLGPTGPTGGRVSRGPAPPALAPSVVGSAGTPPLPSGAIGEALAVEQVTLAQFIDEVFAKTLKLNVQIDNAVLQRTDQVTMRTGKPLVPDELLVMAEKILAGYGIGASWDGSVMHIAPNDVLMSQMPSLIRSRALPAVPKVLQPIFQIVGVNRVSANDMIPLLTNAYGTKIKLFSAPKDNSVMIFGLPENVAAAVEAVRVLDEPRFAGRQSARFNPVYWSAQGLAGKLVDILRAEGYDAAVSSPTTAAMAPAIILMPAEANNSVLAFSGDPAVLSHISRWVLDLDKPGEVDPAHNIFIYLVQNTTAASLGETVQNVLRGGQAGAPASTPEVRLEQAGQTQPSQPASPSQPARPAPPPTSTTRQQTGEALAGPRLVIDEPRNALILIGTAQDYQKIRPLLAAMDKAPLEALIEVTVVEIGLDETSDLGVEIAGMTGLADGFKQALGTGTKVLSGGSKGLSLATAGFNYAILNRSADTGILLNAFAQKKRLSVLSTPRVLAESGREAKIEVGTEVPIITSQGTTNTIQNAGTTGILQSIEYRKTGVLLTVKPVVHSGDRIDLGVTQEVSGTLVNTTPGITSPLIQNRRVSTQVTLSDGQTVVLGGLITENRTDVNSGVPYLQDIPGLGLLFKHQTPSKTRSELLVFITPYVISNDADSAQITEQFQDQMRHWAIPTGQIHR
jgi:general secretion pathway protein D